MSNSDLHPGIFLKAFFGLFLRDLRVLTPGIAHMPWWAVLAALVFFTAALWRWGFNLARVLS